MQKQIIKREGHGLNVAGIAAKIQMTTMFSFVTGFDKQSDNEKDSKSLCIKKKSYSSTLEKGNQRGFATNTTYISL